MSHDITPVIRRDWQSEDSEATVESVLRDDTRFVRGLGDSGKRVEHVEYEPGCPCCGHEQMVRHVHVDPTARDGVRYWCLRPNCRYFLADALSYATKPHPEYVPETPAVFDQTHECMECGRLESKTITKETYEAKTVVEGAVLDVCDDCEPTQEEVSA